MGRNLEDGEEEGMNLRGSEISRLDRLDNAALAALATPKPNSTCKYNFYVQLGELMST